MLNVCNLFVSPSHNFYGHHGQPAGERPIMDVEQIECVAGRDSRYRGTQGTAIVGLFGAAVAWTGLSEKTLNRIGRLMMLAYNLFLLFKQKKLYRIFGLVRIIVEK